MNVYSHKNGQCCLLSSILKLAKNPGFNDNFFLFIYKTVKAMRPHFILELVNSLQVCGVESRIYFISFYLISFHFVSSFHSFHFIILHFFHFVSFVSFRFISFPFISFLFRFVLFSFRFIHFIYYVFHQAPMNVQVRDS